MNRQRSQFLNPDGPRRLIAAHLAHSIWPERVVPKCAKDRSLAIAHGLEEALWVEFTDAKGKTKWQARQDAEEIAEELIKQHV